MSDEAPEPASTKHYFVDEAGDATLFDHRGHVIAGTEGCSSHFILGVLSVADPVGLNTRLAALHQQLVADPFFKGVESFKPERKKTALLSKTTIAFRRSIISFGRSSASTQSRKIAISSFSGQRSA